MLKREQIDCCIAFAIPSRERPAVVDVVLTMLREERARTLEEAARECEERAVLNDAVEGPRSLCRDPQTNVVASARSVLAESEK